MATAASMHSELGQIVYAGSNFQHPVQFHSSKEGPIHTVQNWPRSDLDGPVRFEPNRCGPGLIWMAQSGFGQTDVAQI